MKYKIEPMRDIYDEGKIKGYLIFAQEKPRTKWLPCQRHGNPLFYTDMVDAENKLQELIK